MPDPIWKNVHFRSLGKDDLVRLISSMQSELIKLRVHQNYEFASLSQDRQASVFADCNSICYKVAYYENLDYPESTCDFLEPRSQSDLADIVSDLSMMALDLAQHYKIAEIYKRESWPHIYTQGSKLTQELCDYIYADIRTKHTPGIANFGEDGLAGWS